MKRSLFAGAVVSLACGVLGIPGAGASPAADLPEATASCPVDTSPNYPSCVGVVELADPPRRCSTSAAPNKYVATCDITTVPAGRILPTGLYYVSSSPDGAGWAIINDWRCKTNKYGFEVCEPVFVMCDDDDPSLCVSTT